MSEQGDPKGPAGRTSILDVAALAGVSAATVSRSLRGVGKVAPDTRERVWEAARELSYASAFHSAGRAPWKRRVVAVIVPFLTRWYFSTVTAGAADLLRRCDCDVVLYHLGSADDRDRFFAQMPLAGRVDGIITLAMPLTEEHTLSLRALDIPMVSIGTGIPGAPSVGIDQVGAAAAATYHLLNLKHEHIGFIAGIADDPEFSFASSGLRRQGLERALSASGRTLDERLVASGPHGLKGGAAAMTELLSRSVLPTAVLAEYDELAIGALWALRRAGLRVPRDISVVGIDNHEMATMLDLTTVAQGVTEQGVRGAQLLIDVLDGVDVSDQPVIIPTRLLLRGTTGMNPAEAKRESLPDPPRRPRPSR